MDKNLPTEDWGTPDNDAIDFVREGTNIRDFTKAFTAGVLVTIFALGGTAYLMTDKQPKQMQKTTPVAAPTAKP